MNHFKIYIFSQFGCGHLFSHFMMNFWFQKPFLFYNHFFINFWIFTKINSIEHLTKILSWCIVDGWAIYRQTMCTNCLQTCCTIWMWIQTFIVFEIPCHKNLHQWPMRYWEYKISRQWLLLNIAMCLGWYKCLVTPLSVCPQLYTGLTTGQRPPALGRVLNCILATSANPHSRHGRHVINMTRCA